MHFKIIKALSLGVAIFTLLTAVGEIKVQTHILC